MKRSNRTYYGKKGERLASLYLEKKGYEILDKNIRYKVGEIDIICKKEGSIVFVEVKYRNTCAYGTPSQSITPRKVRHIRSTAEMYIAYKFSKKRSMTYRFDVLEILGLQDDILINHIENAF